RAGDFVDPAEFLELAAGGAERAEHLSVKRKLVDAAGVGVRAIEILRGPGGDADRPGSTALALRSFGTRLGAHPGLDVGRDGDVDLDHALQFSFGIEDLDAAIAAIGDVDVAFGIGGDRVRRVELAFLASGRSPLLDPLAVLIEFRDTRV